MNSIFKEIKIVIVVAAIIQKLYRLVSNLISILKFSHSHYFHLYNHERKTKLSDNDRYNGGTNIA